MAGGGRLGLTCTLPAVWKRIYQYGRPDLDGNNYFPQADIYCGLDILYLQIQYGEASCGLAKWRGQGPSIRGCAPGSGRHLQKHWTCRLEGPSTCAVNISRIS